MANLFWKTKQKTKILLSTPFKTEEVKEQGTVVCSSSRLI